jgi:uncharacterized protein
MIPDQLTQNDRLRLLQLARQALVKAVNGERVPPLNLKDEADCLQEVGATFVTLTIGNELKGCIGTLDATIPLVEDVREHVVAAAIQDYRFTSITPDELPDIKIEISRLTPPKHLEYSDPYELLDKLRPHLDGVVLKKGHRRATFLPQVWEKVSSPEDFLSYLCHKLGESADAWKTQKLEVWIYQVEKFRE